MSTADPASIPLVILPPPVPPALVRSRQPHPSLPQTKRERDALLDAVRRGMAAVPAVPPLSMAELRRRATAALEEAGLGGDLVERHLDYAVVVVNNESWRDGLAAVPFGRRLLLMPKCLRVENRCPAPFDEFGLLCKQCGLCSIQDFQAEAERLGYAVLVAEGSALVMAMIQTGQIDAIVGVSCMPVLEKTFPFVEAAAIPAVAVPLLQDDCIDTTVDVDWVWDYIHLEAADASRRLDLGRLRDTVADWFEPESLDRLMGKAEGHAEQVARAWLAVGGKRWRPFLAAAVFEALRPDRGGPAAAGGMPAPVSLQKIAVAVECFHKASLVHDDIEDGDLERYGEPTLCGAHGVPVALNVGDLLIGEGYRLLAESGLEGDGLRDAVREAATAQRLLCRGQGAELAWSREPAPLASRQVLEIFRLKTAPAFDVALQLAAICAGRADEVGDVLRGYSEAIGIAYQIKDDLEDLLDDSGLAGDGPPGDGPPGDGPPGDAASRPSVVLALAAERARGEDREMLAAIAGGTSHPAATPERLRGAIIAAKADERAALLLESYKEQAVRSLDGLADPTLKGLLRRVLAKIFNELRFEGFCREAEATRAARDAAPQAAAPGG